MTADVVSALSPAEFEALVEGLEWEVKKRRKRWRDQAFQASSVIQ
ncbi:MAG TPA: hypothetical protein VFQ88_13960 [Nevskiaceae bacterium]|nr:hypothetical protein [Nevskiaceae bacterium]